MKLRDIWGFEDKVEIPKKNVGALKVDAIKEFPSSMFGVEIELEGVLNPENWDTPWFAGRTDGSLRNHGREFVSLPMPYEWLVDQLAVFYKQNKISEKNVSERCSVHVHLNCQDMTQEQLEALFMLYQALESLLFAWIGGGRDKGIFCVPLQETTLIEDVLIHTKFDDLIRNWARWHKYTALNLLPLRSFGTVEFRHMGGQASPDKIIRWLQIIGCMNEYCRANYKTIEETLLSLNTTSQYDKLIVDVFGKYANEFLGFNLHMLLESGIIALKFAKGKARLPKSEVKKKSLLTAAERAAIVWRETHVFDDAALIDALGTNNRTTAN